jgi:xylulose-5-phosphate/fructose-6-phosphate phosphoketolase
MLIMRTPKGWTGPKEVHGQIMEGSFHSPQVPYLAAKTDPEELAGLQQWLKSYKPDELFKEDGDVTDEILSVFPTDQSKRLGQRKLVSAGYQALKPIDWKRFQVKKGSQASCMQTVGKLLDQVVQDNPKSFRIFFSPTNSKATSSMK